MKRMIGSFLALSLLASGAAFAGPQHHDDRDDHGKSSHHEQHGNPHKRGDKLPPGARGERVADYHKHGLHKPPKGQEWRKVDGQYVLIAVATGVIASVIAGN